MLKIFFSKHKHKFAQYTPKIVIVAKFTFSNNLPEITTHCTRVQIIYTPILLYHARSLYALFQIYFHNPADVPDYSHSSIKISKSTHSFIQIATHISLTDNRIKSWAPEKRGCYYSNEKWLKYTKIYSYINCYVECQVNNTETMCGCSPIFRISTNGY